MTRLITGVAWSHRGQRGAGHTNASWRVMTLSNDSSQTELCTRHLLTRAHTHTHTLSQTDTHTDTLTPASSRDADSIVANHFSLVFFPSM